MTLDKKVKNYLAHWIKVLVWKKKKKNNGCLFTFIMDIPQAKLL